MLLVGQVEIKGDIKHVNGLDQGKHFTTYPLRTEAYLCP